MYVCIYIYIYIYIYMYTTSTEWWLDRSTAATGLGCLEHINYFIYINRYQAIYLFSFSILF